MKAPNIQKGKWENDELMFLLRDDTGHAFLHLDCENLDDEEPTLKFISGSKKVAEVLNNILSAHESKNNGAVMGEAVLCKHFETAAKEALKACGYTEY